MAYRQGNFAASQIRHSQPDTYPPKTSANGHYEPKYTYASGYTEYKWVEAPTPKAAAPVATPAPAPARAAPVDKPAPIKHSPEIQQAKERVKTYENNILSGKTSEDIYGKSNLDNLADDDSSPQKFSKHDVDLFQNYNFNSSDNMFQV